MDWEEVETAVEVVEANWEVLETAGEADWEEVETAVEVVEANWEEVAMAGEVD